MLNINGALCISFIGMVIFVYRFYKKNIEHIIDAKVDDVIKQIETVENKQTETAEQLLKLNTVLKNIKEINKENILNAKSRAESILQENNTQIDKIVQQKKKESEIIIDKIKRGVDFNLKNKLIECAVNETKEKFQHLSRDEHNVLIEKSIKMLENL